MSEPDRFLIKQSLWLHPETCLKKDAPKIEVTRFKIKRRCPQYIVVARKHDEDREKQVKLNMMGVVNSQNFVDSKNMIYRAVITEDTPAEIEKARANLVKAAHKVVDEYFTAFSNAKKVLESLT